VCFPLFPCLLLSCVRTHHPPSSWPPILLLPRIFGVCPHLPIPLRHSQCLPLCPPLFSLFASAFPASTLQAAQTPHKFSAWKHACSPGTDPCAHAHIHTQHSKRRNNWHQKHDRRLEGSLEGLFYAAVRDWRVRVIAATVTVGTSTFWSIKMGWTTGSNA